MEPRRLLILRGTRAETATSAADVVAGLEPARVLHAGGEGTPLGRLRTLLGADFDAVVLDLHLGFDPDAIGRAHGLVIGGGALVLRLGGPPPERLAVWPYTREDVGRRLEARFLEVAAAPDLKGPLRPRRPDGGTAEQARVVDRLVALLSAPGPSRVALLADRGRGKSAALGLALARLRPARAVLTAGHPENVREVVRFAGDAAPPFVSTGELLELDGLDLVVVDEAARLPVPLLDRITRRHRGAHLVFATTTHGYEGTGRGFTHRFLPDLRHIRLELEAPIRWGPDDPLERAVFEALLLDAEPAEPPDVGPEEVEAVHLDRDALAADERRLREVFGLLVHAHYCTTPGDLHRALDAPNVHLHALLVRGRVVAATLVAEEGGLTPERVDAVHAGRARLRGHALADALVAHLGRREAGSLKMARSVRIAVHPALRRRGLATRLVEHVHAHHAPDLFGTLFGATPGLLAFRRRAGYRLVRLSASRGARSGEPSVLMVRPVSLAARALVDSLRVELAHELPLQLALHGAELPVEPALAAALRAGLPEPPPRTLARRRALAEAYADGPRTYESVATAVTELVNANPTGLADLGETEQALIRARVLERRPWRAVVSAAGVASVPAAMRGLRRAVRAFLARVE